MSDYSKLGFSGHETFPFRAAWLPKAYRFSREKPGIFADEDAMVTFGVGKNMVRSIRHWALATDVLREVPRRGIRENDVQPTEFGEKLLGESGWDPYLEDPASLWLLHWKLTGKPERAAMWHYVFNVSPRSSYSRDELRSSATLWAHSVGSKVASRSIDRDVDCFVRSYTIAKSTRTVPLEDNLACPLTELELVRTVENGRVVVLERRERVGLPDEVVAEILIAYMRSHFPGRTSIDVEQIVFSAESPGRVFMLSEDAFIRRLERLERLTSGLLVYDETAGMRRVSVAGELPEPHTFLNQYYRRSSHQEASGAAA